MSLGHEAGVPTQPVSAPPPSSHHHGGERASFQSLANDYVEGVEARGDVGGEKANSQEEVPCTEGSTCDGGEHELDRYVNQCQLLARNPLADTCADGTW